MKTNQSVVAIVCSTYRRPKELRRFLECIRNCADVSIVSICDNYGCDETCGMVEEVAARGPYRIIYKRAKSNGGCGAGLNQAIDNARRNLDGITHFWICDDDIAFEGDVLRELIAAIENAKAGSAAPALTDHSDLVIATPMLTEPHQGKRVKLGIPKAEFSQIFLKGENLPFTVCMGTCHLVTAQAMEAVGSIREDFWMLGEDLNFAHRIVAHGGGGVFVPWVFVQHLYGQPLDPASAARSDYLKHLSFIQNLTFMAYQTPYAKYLRGRYFDFLRGKGLAPNYLKFLKKFGWKKIALTDLITVVIAAWFFCQPAGGQIGAKVRAKRFLQNPKDFDI